MDILSTSTPHRATILVKVMSQLNWDMVRLLDFQSHKITEGRKAT